MKISGTSWCRAALDYDETAAALILAGKNRGRRDLLQALAEPLVAAIPAEAQVITWVPASRANRKNRRYDQGKVIARTLSERSQLPARSLLARRPGAAQTGQNRAGRLVGPALVPRHPGRFERVVLVDDVITTGASMRSATKVLKDNGVQQVWGLALAAVA